MTQLFSLSWSSDFEPNTYDADLQISKLMKRYRELPGHIARKHLKASLGRVVRPGVKVLRRNTPPLSTRRGRRKKGEKALSTGALRRSVKVRTGHTGRVNAFDSFVWAVLGYRASFESRKAIWLQYGTSGGVRPYDMIGKTMTEIGPPAASQLAEEMGKALEKAVKDLAPGADHYKPRSS